MKRYTGALFLLWAGAIIVAYYVVQKPGLSAALTGLAGTLWTLLVAAVLLFNAYGFGKRVLYLFKFDTEDLIDQLLFRFGTGLGVLGLLGLLFSAIQLAHAEILTILQFSLAVFFLSPPARHIDCMSVLVYRAGGSWVRELLRTSRDSFP